ncbi:hypothetical protein LINGRAHAP2_LOCUS23531 [Linum grandiflorum]
MSAHFPLHCRMSNPTQVPDLDIPALDPSQPMVEKQIAALAIIAAPRQVLVALAAITAQPPHGNMSYASMELFAPNVRSTFRRFVELYPTLGVEFSELKGYLYLLPCTHLLDVRCIFDEEPWSFNGHMLITHELQSGELPSQVPPNLVEFWV